MSQFALKYLSFKRLFAVMLKEFMQMRRDKTTFAMMIAVPLMQLILFGFAIDLNPKHLPAAVVMQDPNPITQDILQRMEQSQYFRFESQLRHLDDAKRLMARNQIKFIVYFPPNFYKDVVRGLQPQVLLLVDGSDPITAGRSVAIFNELATIVGNNRLSFMAYKDTRLFKTVSLSAFNPEIKTAFHIVPGLLGVVLTMTMVVITSIALTREFERGTMEMLLATPIKPLEVIIGKILPYVGVGYVQVFLILILAKLFFNLPIQGSLIGSVLPLTHFLVIVRGIILKGDSFWDLYPALVKILCFTLVIILISFKRYRKTLD